MAHVIPPVPNRDDQFFWDAVAEDRLVVRRCAGCARLQQPPGPMCPACGSVEWAVGEVSGKGEVYSWIVSRHPNQPDGEGRIVAIIDLAEGVRLVSNLRDVQPAAVRNGMPVEVTFAEVDGIRLPQFRPAGGNA
ncbi:MAG TPA: OB-fold domain-containing protein [Pseudonocardiaceae bacterium]|nr:OB-fold domain-containing protein [Pseudonocardiaceae bacterium]